MALATAVVTFVLGGAEQQSFTLSPALTSNPPKILGATPTVTGAGQGPCSADIVGTPTNTGGTVRISATTDCTVLIIASD
jgi:hypothetical protein